ncbi:MAG: ribosome maturation factor RimP [Actinobacteria bacterium]|nr:ribosome maturation factor RimP [Actinomycetota bacterium]
MSLRRRVDFYGHEERVSRAGRVRLLLQLNRLGGTMAASVEKIRKGIEPVVHAAGADLEELGIQQAGRREIVRVVVDRDGGIDLNLVSEISREISALLDAEPLNSEFDGTFVLEVTSPGVDRPLSELKHWQRSVDRLVEAELKDGTLFVGRILSVTADSAVFEVTEKKTQIQRTVALGDLVRGKVQIEFNRVQVPDEEVVTDGH